MPLSVTVALIEVIAAGNRSVLPAPMVQVPPLNVPLARLDNPGVGNAWSVAPLIALIVLLLISVPTGLTVSNPPVPLAMIDPLLTNVRLADGKLKPPAVPRMVIPDPIMSVVELF